MQKQPQKKPCKFGKKCKDLSSNKGCAFFHPPSHYSKNAKEGDFIDNAKFQASRQNSMPDDQNHKKPEYMPNAFTSNKKGLLWAKKKELENGMADLLQKQSLTKQDKFSIQKVFENFSVEDFDLEFFYKLTYILAKIIKSDKEAQGEFVLVADQTGLFYLPLSENFRDSLVKSAAFNSKEQIFQAAVAVSNILDFYDLMIKMIPSCSQNFNIGHLISFAIYLGTQFPKSFYLICLSPAEIEQKAFLEGLVPKAELFKKAKNVLDQKYAPAPLAQKIDISLKETTSKAIKHEEPEPTDDFRNLSVYPTKHDFEPFKGTLRKNKVSEPFKDVQQYLDIQFRLFREDFYSSLRQGFIDYHDSQVKKKSQFLRFARGKVSEFVVTRNTVGINLVVYVPNKRIRSFNRRFMFGSMLLMSNDKFKSHLVCLIKNFDSKAACETVKKGYINIQVEVASTPDSLDVNKIDLFNETFDIVETKVYFEPYYQILNKLKTFVALPLSDVLVKCEFKKNNPPLYLSEYTGRYDESGRPMTSLLKEVDSFVNSWANDPRHTFDKSQLEALKHIFQTKVALIQGPPGTGKTYVGVHLVRILLRLKQKQLFTGPIFIVCFTNHALDQFLEDIMEFTSKVVRLGGQTKKESFQKFTIQAKREEMKKSHKKSPEFYRLIKNREDGIKKFYDLQNYYEKCFSYPFISSRDMLKESEKWFFDLIYEEYCYAYKNALSHNSRKNHIPKNNKLTFEKYFQSRFHKVPEFGLSVLYWLELLNFDRLTNEWLQKSDNPWLSADEDKYLYDKEEFDAQQELDKNYEVQKYFEVDKEIKNKASQQTKISFMLSAPIENPMKEFINNIDVFDYYNTEYQHRYPQGQLIYDKVFKPYSNVSNEQQSRNKAAQKIVHLTKEEKFALNNFFLNLKYNRLDQMTASMNKIKEQMKALTEIDDEYSRQLIENEDIIGMTTTGTAKYKNILKNINSKIVIIEEAAEVLEAHIIASLASTTEHVVLIGDHMQLRPAVNDIALAEAYNLDISLFERLVNNNMKNVRILVQRRMRPEISGIIRLLYPDLIDDKCVFGRPNIKCLKTNVLFFNHDYKEEADSGSESKSNTGEADIICKFSQLLIKIGYKQEQITILSLYSGQLLYIQKKCISDNLLKAVRVTTVDNFQGEENDIIILSLVRSNQENRIGFLKVTNRVNVALSRARLGLYIFGNANCIKNHELKRYKSDLSKSFWLKVLAYLDQNKFIDDKFILTCSSHKEEITIKTLADFSKCPNGGCTKICQARLECGHSCSNICHDFQITATDKDGHGIYKCLKKCQRPHPCGHQCPNICSKCDINNYKCLIIVNYTHPSCKHTFKVQCNISTSNAIIQCVEKCNRKLACGHDCNKRCYEDCRKLSKYQEEKGFIVACENLIEAQLICGHHVKKPCGQLAIRCVEKCGRRLSCGHECNKRCYEDCRKLSKGQEEKGYISACENLIEAQLACGHRVKKPCGQPIMPCVEKCNRKLACGHACNKICFEDCKKLSKNQQEKGLTSACESLIEVQLICGHRVKKICGQSVVCCLEPCKRKLACGHECDKLCYEDCKKLSKDQEEKGYIAACESLIETQWTCGHSAKKPCGRLFSLFAKEYKCRENCGKLLSDCGHNCEGECYKCFEYQQRERVEVHDRCRHVCNKTLICDHACKDRCTPSKYCSPCVEKCQVRCLHSACPKKCGDPCARCLEPCAYKCEHLKCTQMCFEICNRPPCNKKCEKVLKCLHPCLGFCGEKCPAVCKTCHPGNVAFQILFGYENEEEARFVELDCGHCFESKGLDAYFQTSSQKDSLKYKTCPICKYQIRFCMRYQKIIKSTTHAIDRVKNKIINQDTKLLGEVQFKAINLRVHLGQLQNHNDLCNFVKKWLESIQKCELQADRIYDLHWSLNRVEPYLHIISSEKDASIKSKMVNLSRHFRDICLKNNPSDINKALLERCLVSLQIYSDLCELINNLNNIKNSFWNLFESDLENRKTQNSCSMYIQIIQNANCLISKADVEKISSFIDSAKLQRRIAPKKKLVIVEIVRALGLNSVNWSECPNGHPYAIENSGKIVPQNYCIDCGALIGGASRRLVGNNPQASPIHGSIKPVTNLANPEVEGQSTREPKKAESSKKNACLIF